MGKKVVRSVVIKDKPTIQSLSHSGCIQLFHDVDVTEGTNIKRRAMQPPSASYAMCTWADSNVHICSFFRPLVPRHFATLNKYRRTFL